MIENKQNIPGHIAIIPDGNRRWADDNEVAPWIGHDEGAKKIEEIARVSRELGVRYLSFWGSSVENMQKRPLKERRELIKIYEKYFTKLMSSEAIDKDEVQINIIGYWREQLPSQLVRILEEGIERTKRHKKYFLNFFLSYSGDEEMLDAIRSIASSSHLNADNITKEVVKDSLMTKSLPPVDYLIRTGGEPHLSAGFMMWDIANAQLFFSKKYFPDFGAEEFKKALGEYAKRSRRLGA